MQPSRSWLRLSALGAVGALLVVSSAQAQFTARPFAPPGPARPFQLGFNTAPAVAGGFANPYAGGLFPPAAFNPFLGGGAGLSSSPYSSGTLNNPYGGGGYSPYTPYYTYYDPFGGYFRGVGDLVSSLGKYQIDFQKARLLNQEVARAKIETRRRLYDEWRYARENMPKAEDIRQEARALGLSRARHSPPLTEVISGRSLNDLLDHLKTQHARDQRGQPVNVPEGVLQKINVRSGHGGNIGLLKDGGRLNWPLALRGAAFDEDRRKLEQLFETAIDRARVNGKVDLTVMQDIGNEVKDLNATLEKSVAELAPSQYIEARRYMNFVEDAAKALGDPNVAKYFDRTYEARGKTVADLVKYMADQGLTFAAATPGDENAYQALHAALVRYDETLPEVARAGINKEERKRPR